MCLDENQWTPLHYAASNGHIDTVKYLVKGKHCSVKSIDKRGWYPLHYASHKRHVEVVRYLCEQEECNPMCTTNTQLTPLHIASSIGQTEVLKFLIENQKCDPMCLDENQGTPLHYAAINGCIDTVKYLVEGKHCSVKVIDKRGWYPLYLASEKGHMEVVRYLCVQKECDPMCTTNTQQTPLHIASSNGQTEVLKYLIENQKCDPMCRDEDQWTPLHYATSNGHIDTVKYLVEGKHCSVKVIDKRGWYPLHYASQKGHMEVVRYLCEQKECNPMCTTNTQLTPLHIASGNGQTEVLKYLIENQKCDPMCIDENQWTPLHYAASSGHIDTVKYLVEGKHCSVTSTIKSGWYPLHLASQNGHMEVVRYLCVQKECNPMCTTNLKSTPLHIASSNGQTEVLKFLIENQKCDPMCLGENQGTPLHYAARNGHIDTVKYLVEGKHCSVTSTIKSGWYPLHLASHEGHMEVVRYLCEQKECSPMCTTNTQKTPLHIASDNGQTEVLQFLIDNQKCDPMCLDENQWTPLHYATSNGHIDTLKYLVEGKHCSVKSTDKRGWYPLHLASEKGHMEVVRYLCEQKECNPMCTTNVQKTPLHIASDNGQTEVLQFLIDNQKCDPMCLDENQWTPLHYAARNGHIDTVKYLVEGKHCSVESTDKTGWYPLHYASHKGHVEVVRYLCEQKECSPMCTTNTQLTPLHIASSNGQTHVLIYLIENQKCDPTCLGENQWTPLHYAARNGHIGIVKFFVEGMRCNPLCVTKLGETPLHLAASNTCVDVVRLLLSYEPESYLCIDSQGRTPLMCATEGLWFGDEGISKLLGRDDGTITPYLPSQKEAIISELLLSGADPCNIRVPLDTLSEKFMFLSEPHYRPLPSNAKLYIVGNKAVGKSTLVEALKREGQWLWGIGTKGRGVEPETAGVIPSTHASEHYGPVMIYDFAGHSEYYASHVSVIENATPSSQPIFIIVVDLQNPLHVLEQQLRYWNTFVTKACAQGCSPYFIIAGSHLDCMTPAGVRERKTFFDDFMRKSPSSFNVLGFVVLDGHMAMSDGMSQLRKILSKCCIPAAERIKLNNLHLMLFAFLRWKLGNIAAFQLLDIIEALVEHDTPLPHSCDDVYHLCEGLNTAGHVLLMKDETTPEKSWIVLDQKSILNKVQAFQRSELLQCGLQKGMGIVPLSKIKEYFQDKIHIDAVVKYLTHMEYCREVDTDALKAIGISTSTLEPHYFFPDLIRAESPQHVWDKDTDGNYCQTFAWYLSCYKPDSENFLNPRFIQVLLLHIAANFVLVRPASGLKPGCTIWRNGISWFDGKGTETMVEIMGPRIEQSTAVVVMTRCQRGCEIQHYKHRSEVIETVLGVRSDKVRGVEAEEYVIHPDSIHYPLHPAAVLKLVTIPQIADAIVSCEGFVVSRKRQQQSPSDSHSQERLDNILHFEPFSSLGKELLQMLFAEDQQDSPVTDDLLAKMAIMLHHKWEPLASVLETSPELVWQLQREDSPPVTKCRRVLQEARRTAWGRTYGGLRKRLEKYSIFRGRSPLVHMFERLMCMRVTTTLTFFSICRN